ncbi:hypothetical protein Ahy_A04g020606 [Arachis hypogaea]|uniref:Uncharacterized protein n=1 Tax=Arachis hypogaea TaxID=3818 RepID=A0A445DI47_ARAHY|nr:hypothetical protein Ahy_A04g020606 [Arachis hypogaea]
MMVAKAASFVKHDFPAPSFSLGFSESSQEDTLTQEGPPAAKKGKTQESLILIEELEELVEQVVNTGLAVALNFAEDKNPPRQKLQPAERFVDKFETPARRSEVSGDLIEKCFLWATNIKTYDDKRSNEYDVIYILNHQHLLKITKRHYAPLKANTYIENQIVSAMCLLLNKKRTKRFEEQIYCLPFDIVNLALENHKGEFKQLKTNKSFDIQDYKMSIPYLDMKKLAFHPFAEVDHFKVEYTSLILFDEMNQLRDRAIQESEDIRLSKPSAALLSPYCQLDSEDIDNE